MSNPQLETIADQRRASALHRINTERERVARALTMNVIGASGAPRPAAQTAEVQKVLDGLDAKVVRLAALTGDQLVAEFADDCL